MYTTREYALAGDRRSSGVAGQAAAYDETYVQLFEKRSDIQKEEASDHWVDPAKRLSTRAVRR